MISGRKVNKAKKLHYNLRRYIASGLAGIANIFQYIEKHNKEAHAFDGQTDDGLSLFAWCFVNNHYGLVKLLLLSACPIDAEYLNKFPEFAAKLVVQLLDTQGTSYDEAARRLLSCPKFNINIKYGDEPILFVAVKKASHATLQALLARRPLDPEVRAVNLLRYANLSEQKKLLLDMDCC